MTIYVSPVDKLLTLGDPGEDREWRNYRALGIHEEHISDLIHMSLDQELRWEGAEGESMWGPIHAWRALGELRAQAAIEPLLSLFPNIDKRDDEWAGEELPEVYARIGPPAIPALATYLADSHDGLWARVGASTSLGKIGTRYPEARTQVVSALTRALERFAENDPGLNGSLVAELLELHAVESASVMERAFAAEAVDEMVAGDWEDVQIELGLKKERTGPRKPSPISKTLDEIASQFKSRSRLSDWQVDDVIEQMRAEGVLKPAAKPKPEKQKKKHKRQK